MSEVLSKYTVIREYKNECSIDEMLKRIIRIHVNTVPMNFTKDKECSNHEVDYDE